MDASKLEFSILDHLAPQEKAALLAKAKYVYTEAGQFVRREEKPSTLYIVTHGLISLRSTANARFDFGQVIVGRSLELRSLFVNAPGWEFAWLAVQPTTLAAISWKDFMACLSRNGNKNLFVHRISIAVELQRLARDLRAFACPAGCIEELVTKFKHYKDAALAAKLKESGKYFIVLSSGHIELTSDSEGKRIAFTSIESGEHFLAEISPSIIPRIAPNTGAYVLSEAEWKAMRFAKDFDFFLSLHAGLNYEPVPVGDTDQDMTVRIMRGETQGKMTELARGQDWSPLSSIRAVTGERYLTWAPDESFLRDACLSTLLSLHGHDLPLETSRQDFLWLQNKEPLNSIQDVARNFGYDTVISKGELAKAPALIVYRNKPMVVLSCHENHVEVGDPNTLLTRTISYNRLKKYSNGEALHFTGVIPAKNSGSKAPVMQYFNLLKGSRAALFLLGCAGFLTFAFTLSTLMLSQFVFERIPHETNNQIVYMVIGAYVGCAFLAALVEWIEKSCKSRLSWVLAGKIQSAYIQHVLRIPLSAFDSLNKGEVFNRFTDARNLSDFMSAETMGLMTHLTSLAVCSYVLFMYNPLLCGVLAAAVPLIAVLTWFLPSKIKRAKLRAAQAKSVIKTRTINALENLEAVNSNNAMRSERWKIEAAMFREMKIKNQLSRYTSIQEGLVDVFTEATKIAALSLGVFLFMRHQLTLGKVMSTPFLIERAMVPLIAIFNLIFRIPAYLATAQRLHSVFGVAAEEIKANEKLSGVTWKGDIKFKNVDFAFHSAGKKVLEGIDLHIRPGEVIAIAGDSGSGKSTLVSLLNRMRLPLAGQILVDDRPIDGMPLDVLRSAIGILPQTGGPMRGTVAENISMFDPSATPEKIERAAKIAGAHDMISGLPQGYSTKLETNGVGLSEGQGQLICIARLVYSDPAVFVLDESTAHIDALSEEALFKSLLSAFKGRTFILVTQKLNALLKADRIVYVSNGKAIEVGSHAELIRNKGSYCDFVCKQICVNI